MERETDSSKTVVKWVAIVAAVLLIGWLIWWNYGRTQQKQATTTPPAAPPTAEQPKPIAPSDYRLAVDTDKLGAIAWQVTTNTDELVSLTHGGMGAKPGESCFAEAEYKIDSNARQADATAFRQARYQEYLAGIKDNKGYTASEKSETTVPMTIETAAAPRGEKVIIPATKARLTSPDNSQKMYQAKGYLVRDGWYVATTESCDAEDLSLAERAFSSITLQRKR